MQSGGSFRVFDVLLGDLYNDFMLQAAAILMGVFTLLCVADGWRNARFQRRCRSRAVAQFTSDPTESRESRMSRLVECEPQNAAAWYLLGAIALRKGRVRDAARAFGFAFHRDCDLESAALLTFACLKAREDGAQMVELIRLTWEEMKRPALLARAADRELAACLASTTRDPPTKSPIDTLIWNATGAEDQRRIELQTAGESTTH